MPTDQFNRLNEDKKNAVIQAALKEFGEAGVLNASTNSMVKRCGISKGSLFKYFETKDDLCFYLFDLVTDRMLADLSDNLPHFSTELFKRIIDYSVWETGWYIKNPMEGRFVIAVAEETDKDFVRKRTTRYGPKSNNVYEELLRDTDMESLTADRRRASQMIGWVIEGYNKEFLSVADTKSKGLDTLQQEYLQGINEYVSILKKGLTG